MEDLRKQRILIVDDAPENIKVLREALKEEYRISFATSGEDALKVATADKSIDLILLDVMMPGLDGYEVCRQLKLQSDTRNIPVIFITARSSEADETRGFNVGAVDYITKPFSRAIVRARVRTHLELKRSRDILENLSRIDGLTGISNRRRFDEYLRSAWKQAIRDDVPLSLLMIDIDCFKQYNDTYKHLAGDDCLKRVADALTRSVQRPLDFVARYGGEEFAVVLPDTDVEGSGHVAESMRRAVESLRIPHSRSVAGDIVTVSLGAATIRPRKHESEQIVIEGSDEALYGAKSSGRNRVYGIDLEKRRAPASARSSEPRM